MLKPEVKEAWINALLDGEYPQGKEKLVRVEDGQEKFCCLGVLCDLHAKKTGDVQRIKWDRYLGYNPKGADPSRVHTGLCPEETMEWAGLNNDEQMMLVALNDGGAQFHAIAQYIERHL